MSVGLVVNTSGSYWVRMKPSTILFIAVAVVAVGAIPLYGLITGHYAEMMGGG